jgi:hypothetical protein
VASSGDWAEAVGQKLWALHEHLGQGSSEGAGHHKGASTLIAEGGRPEGLGRRPSNLIMFSVSHNKHHFRVFFL